MTLFGVSHLDVLSARSDLFSKNTVLENCFLALNSNVIVKFPYLSICYCF